MASSQTQNLQLIEYGAGSDNFLRTDYNGNLTKIDEFAGKTNDSLSAGQNGLAYIVGNTNTTGGTLAVGQFVYVKGHSTISEGLRKVTASISANGSITTSNTDACSEGGLNALNSKITNIGTVEIISFTTQNVSSESETVLGTKSLQAGTYLVSGWITFRASNGTGVRSIRYKIDDGSSIEINSLSAPGSDWCVMNYSLCIQLNTAATISIMALQKSGSTIQTAGYGVAVRIA